MRFGGYELFNGSNFEKSLVILNRKILTHYLTHLRDKRTDCKRFREVVEKIGMLEAYEIAEELETEPIEIDTPIARGFESEILSRKNPIVLVGVLRAGLHMVSGALRIFEDASVGFVSAKRLEEASIDNFQFEVRIDYINIPPIDNAYLIIMDPMLATGSTSLKVIERILEVGRPKKVIYASIIATPLGSSRLLSRYPNLKIYTVAIDKELDNYGFIVPGLGDAGDRLYNC